MAFRPPAERCPRGGKGMFTSSSRAMDFAYIDILKEKLSRPGKGKGCVNARYTCPDERLNLLEATEAVIDRKKTLQNNCLS